MSSAHFAARIRFIIDGMMGAAIPPLLQWWHEENRQYISVNGFGNVRFKLRSNQYQTTWTKMSIKLFTLSIMNSVKFCTDILHPSD